MAEAVQASGGHRQNRGFILGALTFGARGGPPLRPGFSGVPDRHRQYPRPEHASRPGFLLGIRTSGNGLISMGSGVLVDRFPRPVGPDAHHLHGAERHRLRGDRPVAQLGHSDHRRLADFHTRIAVAPAGHRIALPALLRPESILHIHPQLRLHRGQRPGTAGGGSAAGCTWCGARSCSCTPYPAGWWRCSSGGR